MSCSHVLFVKFPRLTFEKVKAGMFIGPQNRQLYKGQQFEAVLSEKAKGAWKFFEKVFVWFSRKFQRCRFKRTCTRSGGFLRTAGMH